MGHPGAPPEDIKANAGLLGPKGRDGGLKEGQKLRILLSPASLAGQRQQPVRLILIGDTAVEAVGALFHIGKNVSGDVPNAEGAAAASGDYEDDSSRVLLF